MQKKLKIMFFISSQTNIAVARLKKNYNLLPVGQCEWHKGKVWPEYMLLNFYSSLTKFLLF